MADVDLDALEQAVSSLDYLALNTDARDYSVRAIVTIIEAAPDMLTELRRLRGQACPECRHNRPRDMGHFTHEQYCYLHTRPVSFFRGGCRAGEAKGPNHGE